jgi:hypothetical protein
VFDEETVDRNKYLGVMQIWNNIYLIYNIWH